MRWIVTVTFAFTLACSKDGSSDASDTETTTTSSSDSETGETNGVDTIGLSCDPSSNDSMCGGQCCSDDPAAILLSDLEAQVTPSYSGTGGTGTPVFSADNNNLSRWGVCEAPMPDGLVEAAAMGCPIPCNPAWSSADIVAICGPNRVCCQTVELEPEDCVFDPNLGDAGCHRPVTGNDIVGFGGLEATNWGAMSHKTHQDPDGTACEAFVLHLNPDDLANNNVTDQQVLLACYRRLVVANRRGFCMESSIDCPYDDLDYVDACEQLNADEGLAGCG